MMPTARVEPERIGHIIDQFRDASRLFNEKADAKFLTTVRQYFTNDFNVDVACGQACNSPELLPLTKLLFGEGQQFIDELHLLSVKCQLLYAIIYGTTPCIASDKFPGDFRELRTQIHQMLDTFQKVVTCHQPSPTSTTKCVEANCTDYNPYNETDGKQDYLRDAMKLLDTITDATMSSNEEMALMMRDREVNANAVNDSYTSSAEDLYRNDSSSVRSGAESVAPSALSFSVKIVSGIMRSKAAVELDERNNRITIIGWNQDRIKRQNVIDIDRIIGVDVLVADSRVKLFMLGYQKEHITFHEPNDLDRFCEKLDELMARKSTALSLDNHLTVFVGTWNCGNANERSLSDWLRHTDICNVWHDLLVVGTQENTVDTRTWCNEVASTLRQLVQQPYEVVYATSLKDVKMVILCKAHLTRLISNYRCYRVKTGFGNVLANKGATAACFQVADTRFCFVNSHFCSHYEDVQKRTDNFRRTHIALSHYLSKSNCRAHLWQPPEEQLGPVVRNIRTLFWKHSPPDLVVDFQLQCHYVFWFGDLNYRLMFDNVDHVLRCIESAHFADLLRGDQLKVLQIAQDVFYGFEEADITFAPTYRFEPGTSRYKFKKVSKNLSTRLNVPSWCDRILWHRWPTLPLQCLKYDSVVQCVGGDHRPVYGSFRLLCLQQSGPPRAPLCANVALPCQLAGCLSSHPCFVDTVVELQNLTVEIRLPPAHTQVAQPTFQLNFSSGLLCRPTAIGQLATPWPDRDGYFRLEWEKVLLMLKVCEGDRLEQCFIQVLLTNPDSNSVFGSCVLPLAYGVGGLVGTNEEPRSLERETAREEERQRRRSLSSDETSSDGVIWETRRSTVARIPLGEASGVGGRSRPAPGSVARSLCTFEVELVKDCVGVGQFAGAISVVTPVKSSNV